MGLDFSTKFNTWEKSALMCCEECSEFDDPDGIIRDCPDCGKALCFTCGEEHVNENCEDWDDDDDDFDDDDFDDWEEEEEENNDDEGEE